MPGNGSGYDREAVKTIVDDALTGGRQSLTAPEAKRVADAYGIATPGEGLATSAAAAADLAERLGFPVVLKIASPDILHKTEAGGVLVGLRTREEVDAGYRTVVENARAYREDAAILGVQVQRQLTGGHEVIVGAVTDPTF